MADTSVDALPGTPVAAGTKLGYGLVLPLGVFLLYQFWLMGTRDGTGSWDGMNIFFWSLGLIPGLAIANIWVFPLTWRKRSHLFCAALALPAIVAFWEFGFIFLRNKHTFIRNLYGSLLGDTPVVVFEISLLFAPLVVSLYFAAIRRRSVKTRS